MRLIKALVLILAHPDDESFAFAGLIQRALRKKYTVQLHTLTQGEAASPSGSIKDKNKMALVRKRELEEVGNLLKIERYQYMLPDGRLTQMEVKVREIVKEIVNKNRGAVFTTTYSQTTSHPDHKMISKLLEEQGEQNLVFHYRPDRWQATTGKQYKLYLTGNESKTKLEVLSYHVSQKDDVERYLQKYVPVEYFFSPKPTNSVEQLFVEDDKDALPPHPGPCK